MSVKDVAGVSQACVFWAPLWCHCGPVLFLHGSPKSQLCSIEEISGLGQREHGA